MIESAKEASGDPEIAVAGLFLPRGFVGHTMLGTFAGNLAGGAVGGDTAQMLGSVAGASAGMGSAAAEAGGLNFIVAVSPTRVHVLQPETIHVVSATSGPYRVLHSFERSRLDVQVKARTTIRKLVLHDEVDDVTIELQGSRAWFKHANDVIHALVIDGHGDLPVEAPDERGVDQTTP